MLNGGCDVCDEVMIYSMAGTYPFFINFFFVWLVVGTGQGGREEGKGGLDSRGTIAFNPIPRTVILFHNVLDTAKSRSLRKSDLGLGLWKSAERSVICSFGLCYAMAAGF